MAQVAPAAAPVRVAEGVYLLRDSFDPGRQPDGNSTVFAGPRGLVVVDTGRHAAHAQALLDFAAARAQPIVLVVNTHWHLDHLGGNALLRERVPGLKVIASDAAHLLGADRVSLWIHGHTHDSFDYRVNGTRVVAAGDLVTLPVPFLDTACAPRWRMALAELDALPFETLIPGHGAPMTRRDFARWRSAFGGLLDCAAGTASARSCADGWIAGVGELLAADERGRARAMLDYYVGEQLRAAPAQRDRFCAAPAGKTPP